MKKMMTEIIISAYCGSLHLRTIQGFQKLSGEKQTFGTLGWFEEYYQQPELDKVWSYFTLIQ